MHFVVAIDEHSGAIIFTVLTLSDNYWYIYSINLLRNSQHHLYIKWTVNGQQHLLHALKKIKRL